VILTRLIGQEFTVYELYLSQDNLARQSAKYVEDKKRRDETVLAKFFQNHAPKSKSYNKPVHSSFPDFLYFQIADDSFILISLNC
jgi:hypothetical protein